MIKAFPIWGHLIFTSSLFSVDEKEQDIVLYGFKILETWLEKDVCRTNRTILSGSMRTQAHSQNHRILGKFGFCHQWRNTIQRRWTWLLYNPDSFFSAESRSVYQQTVQGRNSCAEHLLAHRSYYRFLHWNTGCSCSKHWYTRRHQHMERCG